ncbi:UNVERIFIED_CONTAM: Lysine-specific demethylase [Sesamum angustifolium]|uniref:Lysine-specific demethylase n=1 Tax=Sesamum angustifolium TaxID=2727405 RepID=A0AAW2KVU5_9LAMI
MSTKAYGGCASSLLTLKRIFKMNWVAKLVKNVEEMVNGCKICNSGNPEETGAGARLWQAAHRENVNDNFLYCPSSEDLKNGGIKDFRVHWSKGKPVIVKEVCDASAMTIWDPMVIWRGIKETAEERVRDINRTVKAIDCSNWTEINIELEEFMNGYFDGRVHDNGQPQLLKLKDWPSPSASEEFLLYQRPDFISKLPLLEFIHSKWGLLNVAAKLPHYSLQNDVFLLVHACEVKLKGVQGTRTEIQNAVAQSETQEMRIDPDIHLNSGGFSNLSPDGPDGSETNAHSNDYENKDDQEIEGSSAIGEKAVNDSEDGSNGKILEKTQAGAFWDVFRREDIPKLMEYISMHWKNFQKADNLIDDYVSRPLYDGVVYLNRHHKSKLREEFGVEPWSFEQHIGEAVFILLDVLSKQDIFSYMFREIHSRYEKLIHVTDPDSFSHPFPQSSVQLGLDFLSPESLGEALKLSEEIRGLPNDHDAKLQILEVGKISLYAASSAIKEVQKLVLDPKLGPELGFEDPNLTSLVSQNLENMVKRRQITCT